MGDFGTRVESTAFPMVYDAEDVSGPVGSLSFVFTDIEDSTALWETVPVAMREIVANA